MVCTVQWWENEEGVKMVPTAIHLHYMHVYMTESYCYEIAVCGVIVCVILLNVMRL
jgi:hypothetical protein